MTVKFFGQFLLEKNIIKSDELVEAVEYQEASNKSFGEYAVSKGYLNAQEVERLLKEQKQIDMRLGDIALKLGLLNPDQLQEIATAQKNNHMFLGEALIEKGFLTREVLEKELALFKEDQDRYRTDVITTPAGVRNPEIVKDAIEITQKMLNRLTHQVVKIKDGVISTHEPPPNFLLISILLYGAVNYNYVFSLTEDISKLITASFFDDDTQDKQHEVIVDSVKEFCNITCGNIIAKSSMKGNSINITPPEEVICSEDGYHVVKGMPAIYVPLITPKGESTLILIEGK
jgi:CheY-specific phosphatase CheX